MTILNRVWRWLHEIKIISFMKWDSLRISELPRPGSKLLDSIMVDGKKVFGKLVVSVKKGFLFLFLSIMCVEKIEDVQCLKSL